MKLNELKNKEQKLANELISLKNEIARIEKNKPNIPKKLYNKILAKATEFRQIKTFEVIYKGVKIDADVIWESTCELDICYASIVTKTTEGRAVVEFFVACISQDECEYCVEQSFRKSEEFRVYNKKFSMFIDKMLKYQNKYSDFDFKELIKKVDRKISYSGLQPDFKEKYGILWCNKRKNRRN